MQNGKPLYARFPEVLDQWAIGWVENARIKRNRLIADGVFDIEWTKRVDNRIIDALTQNQQIELSTGLITDNLSVPLAIAEDGRQYRQIATNYLPDHLAILPDPGLQPQGWLWSANKQFETGNQ